MTEATRFAAIRFPAREAKAPVPVTTVKPPKALKPPNWLTEEARAEWRRVTKLLGGLLEPRHTDVLALYCTQWAEYRRRPGEFKSAQITQLRQLQVALGMAPGNRGRH